MATKRTFDDYVLPAIWEGDFSSSLPDLGVKAVSICFDDKEIVPGFPVRMARSDLLRGRIP